MLCCVVDVDTEVSESEIEVPVGVKVRERKDMIFGERLLRRVDCSGFLDGYFHFFRWTADGCDRRLFVVFCLSCI